MPNSNTRFVILTEARTGSNLLVSLLDSHPDITCHSEVFHRKKVYAKPPLDSMSVQWRNTHVREVLETIFANLDEGSESHATGFKLFWYHKPSLLFRLARKPEFRFIVLRRDDKLSQYASRKIALKTGEWKGVGKRGVPTEAPMRAGSDGHSQVTVRYSFFGHLGYRAFSATGFFLAMRVLHHYRSTLLQLRYEDMEADMACEMDRLLSFLDVPQMELTTELTRQNTSNAIDRFSNQKWARQCVTAQEKAVAVLWKIRKSISGLR